MSHKLSRPSWKQCALLLILLSHAVFGSPVVPAAASAYETLSPVSQADTLGTSNLQASLQEDVFGPTHDERSERKKRLLYETLKKAKQAKLLTLGAASSSAAKSIGKSVFKTVATFGIKAIIFNFLYSTKAKLGLLKKVLKKVANPLNAILFYHAGTLIAAHLTSTVSPHYQYNYHPEPSPQSYSIDDATQQYNNPPLLLTKSDNSALEPAEPSNAKEEEAETTTMTSLLDEYSMTKYDNYNANDQVPRDRYLPQNNHNYYEPNGFDFHQSIRTRSEYPVHDAEPNRYPVAQTGGEQHPPQQQQQYYYTYEHARALPPPFGYETRY